MMTDDYKRRIAGELKLEPLVGIDPNDQDALDALVAEAIVISENAGIDVTDGETLKLMAVSVNHWGGDFIDSSWAQRILADAHENDLEKLQEMHQYNAFQKAGPEAVDFAAYCILKFNRRVPQHDYNPGDIHYASDMAVSIAQQYDIHDLLNTYACTEMILITAGNFIENPICEPIKHIFENKHYDADAKIRQSSEWLKENLQRVFAYLERQQ